MTHTHPIRKPAPTDLVFVRFAVPSKMATVTPTEVFVRTCAGNVIRVPATLLKTSASGKSPKSADKVGHLLFEARVPRDLAAAIRSIYGELFRLIRASQVRELVSAA